MLVFLYTVLEILESYSYTCNPVTMFKCIFTCIHIFYMYIGEGVCVYNKLVKELCGISLLRTSFDLLLVN